MVKNHLHHIKPLLTYASIGLLILHLAYCESGSKHLVLAAIVCLLLFVILDERKQTHWPEYQVYEEPISYPTLNQDQTIVVPTLIPEEPIIHQSAPTGGFHHQIMNRKEAEYQSRRRLAGAFGDPAMHHNENYRVVPGHQMGFRSVMKREFVL